MSHAIRIKPMSVNGAWRGGKRYRTKEYKAYEDELIYKLPDIEIPEGRLWLDMQVGCSNRLCDVDNFLKPFIDILQKKYGFNDNRIYKIGISKCITHKGAEFVQFSIIELMQDG